MSKTILFTGLEGTLIYPDFDMGACFMGGIADALYDFARIHKTSHLFIVTNCIDVKEGTTELSLLRARLDYVSCCLRIYLNSVTDDVHVSVSCAFCNYERSYTDWCKPYTGMLDYMLRNYVIHNIPPKQDMLMISRGSDDDDECEPDYEYGEQTAKSFGIDCVDADRFILDKSFRERGC
jgi:hypothetical protein